MNKQVMRKPIVERYKPERQTLSGRRSPLSQVEKKGYHLVQDVQDYDYCSKKEEYGVFKPKEIADSFAKRLNMDIIYRPYITSYSLTKSIAIYGKLI